MICRLALLAVFAAPLSASLIDPPITSDGGVAHYLDGEDWVLSAPGFTPIRATVPGDIVTDLQVAGLVGDPLYEVNWIRDAGVWANNAWTYSKSFAVSAADIATINAGGDVWLVLDGAKMSSSVSVNGVTVGTTTDQYLRYTFSLKGASLVVGGNALAVTFDPANQTTEGRNFSMGQSSSGPSLARTLSSGLWRSVYVLSVRSSAITAIAPLVYYTGAYPTAALTDATAAPFNVSTRVHFWSPAGSSGTLTVEGAWGGSASVPLTLPAGESSATVNLAASGVKLWWPVGYGAQPLYAISATFTPSSGVLAASTARNIGFRYAALVTFNDTDPAVVANASVSDGTFNNGMFFRVNGVAVWARGANMIPMDEFEGRYSAAAHERVVMSARDGGMNMLRVWGGGIFQPPSFYDTCDALGIMIYHDMQFAQDGHSPLDGSVAQAAEFRHQVRRLAAHPSIVVIDGCNECHVILGTPTGVYATFVLTIVESEDDSRSIWPSCPSEGWKSGVRGLDSHPNGSPLGLNPQAKPPMIARASLGTAGLLDSAGRLATTDCPGEPCPNCTATPGMDIDGDGEMIHAADAASCCVTCVNITACMGAVFVTPSNECWIKYIGGTPVSTTAPGRLLLIVHGRSNNPPIETHGAYQHGGSTYPAVNGDTTINLFPSLTPISVSSTMTSVVQGVGFPNTFASEFGASVFSSFESMAPTLAPAHWGVHGGAPPDTCGSGFERYCNGTNVMAQRNYPCDNIIIVYFGASDFNAVGEAAFKKHLWQCMLGQALLLKGNIETRRATNQFGHLIWQLNEIWPTGGWGSIEYGTVGFTPGQVIGGRWKPLHYMLARSIFTDVMSSCGVGGQCYVRNDRPVAFSGSLTVTAVTLATGATSVLYSAPTLSLPAGPGAAMWFTLPSTPNANTTVLVIDVVDGSARESWRVMPTFASPLVHTVTGSPVSSNLVLFAPPVYLSLPAANVAVAVNSAPNADGTVDVTLTTDAPALFVTLTTLAQGRFSDNAFLLLPGEPRTITYIAFVSPTDIDVLKTTIRVEHAASYL